MFDSLIVSGGALKGSISLGVLSKHEKDIENVHTYVGCSVGAVICALLCMGATIPEIHHIGMTTKCEIPSGMKLIGVIPTFFSKLGFIHNSTYLDRVREFTMDRFGGIPTLKQLYDLTGKTLFICATALIARKRVMFSYRSHPDLTVIDALEMSIRMPLIFTPIFFDEDLYIDGGMKCHFPIDMRIGRTLAIHTYNKVRKAKDILTSPSIIEYIGLLLSCSSSEEVPLNFDGLLYDIAYERTGPLKTSEEETLDMFKTGVNAVPI